MSFEILGEISQVEIIATGSSIRDLGIGRKEIKRKRYLDDA